uniref:HAT C-terminal dimerisation domain-containing protein n=1 Tax=Triticum urartu TaxID=4572 RepID=A0A8R7PTT7_TRIUA
MSGLMDVIEQFYHDDDDAQNNALNIDLPKFKKKEGMFGKVAATKAITNGNYNAGEWWATYGLQTPTLMHMALRILNLTTSSSGCERNWSVFEQVDANRRNKLDVRHRDDLVYIQFNGRFLDKRKKYSSTCDVLLGEDASTAKDWICEDAYDDEEMGATGVDNTTEPRRSLRVRELHEVEDFFSDDEDDTMPINEDEIEFESDDDMVGVTEENDEED